MISIIIPIYNRKDLLILTLESIEKCDSIEKDLILIDDGSQEDIKNMLVTNFPNLRYNYLKISNKGAAFARNEGIKLANGKYLVFFDSDDLVEKNFFSERLKFLDSNPDISAVYGPWNHVSSTSTIYDFTILPRLDSYPIYSPGNENLIIKNILGGWYINQCSIMWRKSFIEKIGGFKDHLQVNQDVDLVFRALMNGVMISGANLPRTFYRDHDQMRVGNFVGDELKLKQILNLRKEFVRELERKGLFTSELKEELGYFLFNLWAEIRKSSPKIAEDFLDFSVKIKPDLKVRGGKMYLLLSFLFGNRKATIIKQMINKYYVWDFRSN